MNLSLFVAQLNQILQNQPMASCEDVCNLLCMHTFSAVTIINGNGQPIAELLPPAGEKNSGEEHLLSTPIMADDSIIGNISLCRYGDAFCKEEHLALGIANSVCTILLRHSDARLAADKQRRRETVRNLINTLSFSELEAAGEIVKELMRNDKGSGSAGSKTEGLLIAGRIADRLGFARSVVTAALKKLEGASLIEVRSLGMKGTYIRIKDLLLIEELRKL